MLADEVHQLASASGGALGVGAIVGLLLSLWSAPRGMSGSLKRKKLRVSFCSWAMLVALVVVLPAAVQFLDRGPWTK
jgi:hypothetical protein